MNPYLEGIVLIEQFKARVVMGFVIVTFPIWFPFWLIGHTFFKLADRM